MLELLVGPLLNKTSLEWLRYFVRLDRQQIIPPLQNADWLNFGQDVIVRIRNLNNNKNLLIWSLAHLNMFYYQYFCVYI